MKILLFFHGGSLNRGCEAILRTAVDLIKAKNPNAIVNVASFDAETDNEIPLIDTLYATPQNEISKYSISGFISALKIKFQNDETYYQRYKFKKIIDLIPEHDVFLSIGGDNYCYGEQPWIYEVDRLIKKAGKKLVLWGASIGDEDLSEPKIADLKSMDLVLARESLTYAILKDKGVANVKLVADGAFTMQKEEVDLPEGWQEGNTIGFNFSPLVWQRNEASKKAAYELIQHILDTTSMTIALTPHVMVPGNDDHEVLQQFYKDFKASGRILLLPNNLNAIQYKGLIAKMRFFIGARTHATIAAYSSLIPTLVLGYSVKSKGIAKDIFGTEKLVLSINEISDSKKLIAAFDEMVSEEQQLILTLANNIPTIKENAKKAVTYLFELT
ncbi:polysaccharide pyruvyl transferase family protein [Flavobacterium chungnamense]|uniref:Polysaccharide pyruvyl transferase domain-containing protein n=1 Tax=Flavobacterium chungnamense TaxID=706182 RepID=A0ABP7UBL2_9FLAO